jgi:hypothetical protein
MGRCSWVITKGKKSGETCGIYTKKKHNDEYYCASHIKIRQALDEPEEQEESYEEEIEEVEEVKPKSKPKPEKKKVVKKVPNYKVTKRDEKDDTIEPAPEEEIEESIVEPTIENNTLDEVIDYHYQQELKKEESKSQFEIVNEKIDYIIKRLNELFLDNKVNLEPYVVDVDNTVEDINDDYDNLSLEVFK